MLEDPVFHDSRLQAPILTLKLCQYVSGESIDRRAPLPHSAARSSWATRISESGA
jgi:hypothetical protein